MTRSTLVHHPDNEVERTQGNLDRHVGPGLRDAWIDEQRVAASGKSKDALDPGAVHPACGPRVPGPAATSFVRRCRIDIGRDDVRLDLVAGSGLGGQRMVDRVQQREQRLGSVAVTLPGIGQNGPHGRVAVLPAIFTQPRRIALDVAGIEGRHLEGRGEQQRKAGDRPDEIGVERSHRLGRPRRIGRARQHCPALGDRVDAAFLRPC